MLIGASFAQSRDVEAYAINAGLWGIGGYFIAKYTGFGGAEPSVVAGIAAVASMIKTRYDMDAKRIGRKGLLDDKSSPSHFISGARR